MWTTHGKLSDPTSAHFTNAERKNLDKPRAREAALRPAIAKSAKSKRTQFSTGLQSRHLPVPETLTNDFHNSENWLRLGSFSPYFAPFCSNSRPTYPTLRPHLHANAFLPNDPRKLLITKEGALKPRIFPEEPNPPKIITHQRRTHPVRQRDVKYRASESRAVVRPNDCPGISPSRRCI
jgi:hypothetical protein